MVSLWERAEGRADGEWVEAPWPEVGGATGGARSGGVRGWVVDDREDLGGDGEKVELGELFGAIGWARIGVISERVAGIVSAGAEGDGGGVRRRVEHGERIGNGMSE
jgi:hypothetical protein